MWRRLAAIAALGVLGSCDGADGTRGPCAAGGQILGDEQCGEVETSEDACWKLVECGVVPLDHVDEGGLDWGRCVGRLEDMGETNRRLALACVDAASCDELIVRGSPNNPQNEWPDCLELP